MVSVITCTYNDAHYLARLLPTIAADPTPKEIIVVDDGSTVAIPDHVHKLMNELGVRYIRHDENEGLSAARNTGIAAAKSDLVFVIDADDVLLQSGLAKLVRAVDDDHDIFYGNIMCAGAVSKPVPRPWTKATWQERNPLFCSSLFRKSVWERVGGYLVRKGPHYEDYRFWCTAWVMMIPFKYVDELVYDHTEREDSMLRVLHPNRDFYHALAIEPLGEL